MKNKYWLWLIFILALFLRLYKLGSLPFNFHEDEVLTGYVGRYIWLNGKDLYNNSWPLLYFNKFGDYYIILPMYIKGLFTFIFGVNEFAVRFPTAILGAVAIFPVYYFSIWVFKNKTIGSISAFLLAFTPWHIVMSRADAEGIMGSTIYLVGIVMLLKWIETKKNILFVSSITLLLLTYFIYHPFRMLVPISLLPVPFLLLSDKDKRQSFLVTIGMIVLFFGLTIYISLQPWGNSRFQQTSIFGELSGVSIKIQELIYDEGTNNILTAKIFHNKVIGYGREFVYQYLSYFSPSFLFINGGKSFAYRVYEHGLYYFSWFFLMISALYFLYKLNVTRNKNVLYFLYLLLLSPLPAGLTVLDAPNVHRSVTMSLFLAPVFAFGLYEIISIKHWGKKIAIVFSGLLLVEFIYFWHQYSQHSDLFNALYRNDTQKQVVEYIEENISKSTPIYMQLQNTMPLYYLFYTNDFDPMYAKKIGFDIRIDKIKNITFVDSDCPSRMLAGKKLPLDVVIIDSPSCILEDRFEVITYIKGKNPLLTYKILKIKKVPAMLDTINQ